MFGRTGEFEGVFFFFPFEEEDLLMELQREIYRKIILAWTH
jgi:hypothetical protein